MSTKEKKSYKRCSTKGCRKKALVGGKCEVHAQKRPEPSTVRKTENTKKSQDKCNCMSDVCYEIGVIAKKVGNLFER